jgi:hypothetical protein
MKRTAKRADEETVEETVDEEAVEETDDDEDKDEEKEEKTDEEKWAEIDEDFDRDEGPFDINEVDLDEDDVQRLDLGALVVTPFEEMQLQLQVDEARQRVQSFLVGDGASAMEVALFAGPRRTSMLAEIREEITAATEKEGGEVTLVEGPFGVELRRQQPVTDSQGRHGIHVSRTWLVGGPGWVLRGIVFGRAALEPDDEDASIALLECFGNLVVRRGTEPAAPGSLISLTIPELGQQ